MTAAFFKFQPCLKNYKSVDDTHTHVLREILGQFELISLFSYSDVSEFARLLLVSVRL